jgi:hypothetical protein
MINEKRIVPVTKVDLLTLYGNIMKLAGTTVSDVQAAEPGVFVVSSGSGNKIAAEPVKSFDFASGVSSMTVYFVPAFDYEGFKVQGTAVTTLGATVAADGATLYTATLSSGDVTIAKVGF